MNFRKEYPTLGEILCDNRVAERLFTFLKAYTCIITCNTGKLMKARPKQVTTWAHGVRAGTA